MRVFIGKYPSWIGPYQIAEKILFWKDKSDDAVDNLGDTLANITWLVALCEWIGSKRKRAVKVRIDECDTWSLDHTLAYIIHPALQHMRDNKQGAPCVDDEDVPDHLKKSAAPPTANEWDTDDNHFKRWDYVLDEMINAFEHKLDLKDTDGDVWDHDAQRVIYDRIHNGFRLFGKYYQSLWT